MFKIAKRFFGKYRVYIVIGPLAKMVEVVFELLTPLVVAAMIDEGVAAQSVPVVVRYGLTLGVFALVSIAFTLVCQKMAALASQGVATDIRNELYAHINTLSYAELDRFGTPSLVTRITNDVNQVMLALSYGMRMLTRWPFLAIGSMVAAMLIDLQLGLVFLVAMPIIVAVFYVVLKRCIPYYQQMQAKLDRIGQLVREGLTGVRVIRAFVREERERDRFATAADEQADVAIAVGKLTSVLNPCTILVMDLGICAILWMGGLQVDTGALSQGQVMAFVNYMTQVLLSIIYLVNMVVIFTKGSASAARINEVLECEPSVTDAGAAPVELPGVPGAVGAAGQGAGAAEEGVPALQLRGVSFAFSGGGANAVSEVSLALMPGQTLGIIGGTGSGKSTLVNLVARLYDATEGAVELFGTDVRRWPLAQLHQVVGLVPQQASLVSGTIRSNLRWRAADATDAELWAALEVAQAAEFVRTLPDGLDAPVEAGGRNFSGGQRQRLTIARALVGNPQLLVLDDSASALDFKTDAALRHAIRERSRAGSAPEGGGSAGVPLTTIIVSQRVSAVADADLICVMRRGHMVGLGTHDELLRSCSVYEEICLSQLKREELEHGVQVPSGGASSLGAGAPVLAEGGALA